MVNRFCVARCCCGGTPPSILCNPEGLVYDSDQILITETLDVNTNYTSWNDVTGRDDPTPWSPGVSWSFNGFFYTATYPDGTYWDFSTDPGCQIDFATSGNSFTFFSAGSQGVSTSGEVAMLYRDSSNLQRLPLWNPCANNTLRFSFDHSHIIAQPPGDWYLSGTSSPYTYVSLINYASQSTQYPFIDIATVSEYDKDTDTYDNWVAVNIAGGSSTTYHFGNGSTTSAAIVMNLRITPVEQVTLANRWNIEFDITADGSALTIPDHEFELGEERLFGITQGSYFGTTEGEYDKYKVGDVSIELLDVPVIP